MIVKSFDPVSVSTVIVSPTTKSSRSAVALSMATWSGPTGGAPSPLISSPESEESPVHATPRVGAPSCGDRRALLVDQLGVPLQQWLRGGDALDGCDLVGQRGGDRVTLVDLAGVRLEGDGGADLQIDVLGDLGEQVVERVAKAVGEHERADDERNADDDRDGDADQATDAGADALARR